MNLNLTHEQIQKMYNKFPGLELYIFSCEHNNELDDLERNEYILNRSQKDRLAFLRECKKENCF